MALNKEDKADVRGAMGKALANKVSKVTQDRRAEVQKKLKANRDAKPRVSSMRKLFLE